jgi:hypothetical protein
VSDVRDKALDAMASFGATAEWLNKLDRLFAVVRDEAVALAEGGINVDELLAAVEAFRLEFYGREDGSDDPNAVPVSGTPSEVGDMEAKVRALIDGVSLGTIPHSVAALVVSHPPTADMQYIHELSRRLRSVYPDPKPLIILQPHGAPDIGHLDEETMAKAGWTRKED